MLICDGLDEYPEPDNIEKLKNQLVNVKSEIPSIAKLKIIFTTRPEAGFPDHDKIGIKNYVRLPSFSPDQITSFFKKYDRENQLTFEDIKNIN